MEQENAIGFPVSRALSVGDRVMVLASIDQCRRNTAAAGGWTWIASEAAKCGQVFDFLVSMFFSVIDFRSTCILTREESHENATVHVRRME